MKAYRVRIHILSSIATFLLVTSLQSCSNKRIINSHSLFKTLDHDRTGLSFQNALHPTSKFNVFDYMYFYNGSGLGAADFNNDGKIDLFFAANQGDNKLFINTGDCHFKDVTARSGLPQDHGWSTGVSVIDINNDGLMDIYICEAGHLPGHPVTHNQLLICQSIDSDGIPHYRDEASAYGLDFSGYSSQAVFFDYDGDGDLDMYLLNHSIHQNGTFGPRKEKLATTSPYSGDRLYRNEGNGKFTDVTLQSGINSSVIGYGLGIVAADINLDGYPDLYIGNDFHENDYMYINQRNGRFADEIEKRTMHTSQFTMGVDVADVNNDGLPDIISMDMLPYDPYILKRSLGEDSWDIFNMKIGYGYNYQYTRNNLQFNRGNGQFSEVGLYAGVAATDWSWSPLWMDFDNDGLKDLFISNGIPKRLNDIDYINFVSNEEFQAKMRGAGLEERDLDVADKFPEIRLPSKFFHNDGNLQFTDLKEQVENSKKLYSNGAVCADFDGDGDLDIAVNNIDDYAIVYRNLSNDSLDQQYLNINLHGPPANINALGAKVILFANNGIRTYEKYPVRGFLSSMETPVHIGLDHTTVDSAFLVWPDNTFQRFLITRNQKLLTLTYSRGLPAFDYRLLTEHWTNKTRPVKDITQASGLLYKHQENLFPEFDREPLLSHMLSTEGPALAVGDFNKDNLDDVFIGSSKRNKPALFIQLPGGKFSQSHQPALDADSTYEDVDACWTDVNGDGFKDLLIASGGNEFYGADPMLTPRVYLNDGKGKLYKKEDAFDHLFLNASCIVPVELEGDQSPDLFIGARSVPFAYGEIPKSYLLKNDGHGRFTDVTAQYAPELKTVGFVTKAVWFDLDGDGKKDLILSLEWGAIVAFMNHGMTFSKRILTDKKGWWNFILPVDLNGDGHIDFIAGNLGLNSRLTASREQPTRLYYYDFDDNGKKEQLVTYYLDGKELPFANKEELERQMPALKKAFLYADDFAKASLTNLFPLEKLRKADTLTADYFPNAILLNDGHGNFTTKALPWQTQLSSYRDAVIVNANNDSLPDILLVGNYYDNNIQMGRYDADYGTILINKGNGEFEASMLNGLVIKGQTRRIDAIRLNGRNAYILARNNDSARIIQFEDNDLKMAGHDHPQKH